MRKTLLTAVITAFAAACVSWATTSPVRFVFARTECPDVTPPLAGCEPR
jgi:hypothetical protein